MDVVSPPRREDDVRAAGAAAGQGFWVPALLLTVGHVLLTAWWMRSAWWRQDDLVLLSRAAGRPLPDLLLAEYNGHLVPATWFVAWLVDTTDPYGWHWGAMSICAGVLMADVALLALLVRLFGARPGALVPLAMYVSAGSLMTATMWWAAAMQWLPVTASLLLALYHHVGYWQLRRTRNAVGAVLAVAGGLAFFEKAVLVVGVLLAFTVLYDVPGPVRHRVGAALRAAPRYWVAHLVLVGAFSAFYLSVAEGDRNGSRAPADLVALARTVVLDVVVPSVFGGPLEWLGPYSSIPASPGWFRLVAWVLFGAAVVGSLRLRRGAWRAWTLLLGFTAVTLALIATTRLGYFGAAIGLDGRYSTDLVAMTVVCAALAWLPRVDRSAPQDPGTPDPGQPPGQPVAAVVPARRRFAPLAVRAASACFVVAVLVAGTVSAHRYVANWSPPPAEAYLLTLQGELRSRPDVVLFDQRTPERVLQGGFFGDEARLSSLLAPSGLRPTLRSWQTELHVVDDDGRIRAADVPGTPASSATDLLCAPDGQPLRVRLDGGDLPLSTWTMRFGYLVSRATSVRVDLGLASTDVPLEEGLHVVFVQLDGNGDSVVLTPPPDGPGICVNNFVVGRPVPE